MSVISNERMQSLAEESSLQPRCKKRYIWVFRKKQKKLRIEDTMMTQTLNNLHTLWGSKKSLVREVSTGKRTGRQGTRIGHIGLHATNPAKSAEFYRDVFGMEITGGSSSDHPLGATTFLASCPDEQSHEIVLAANPEVAHVAFKVSSLAEFRSFHACVVEKKIPIKFVFNHQESFAFYFDDPDGNMIEVYWPTGDLSRRQPYLEPLDLSQSDEVLLAKIAATT
jgi:catechol-2,3-dioxygenase